MTNKQKRNFLHENLEKRVCELEEQMSKLVALINIGNRETKN